MFLCFVAQLVAALIEGTLRQNMARRRIGALPILPENRDSKSPSFAQVVDSFAARDKHELYENQQLLKVFVDPLTGLQETVLDLLDIPAAVYS